MPRMCISCADDAPLQKWLPFPEQWAKELKLDRYAQGIDAQASEELNTFTEYNDSEENGGDPRFGTYDHPTRGKLQTYFFENSRNTRLYFDAVAQDWNRMPLFWERNVPEVREMLAALDEAIPNWKNVNEQACVSPLLLLQRLIVHFLVACPTGGQLRS